MYKMTYFTIIKGKVSENRKKEFLTDSEVRRFIITNKDKLADYFVLDSSGKNVTERFKK